MDVIELTVLTYGAGCPWTVGLKPDVGPGGCLRQFRMTSLNMLQMPRQISLILDM